MIISEPVECLICGKETRPVFEVLILRKYQEMLYSCEDCGCAFFDQPGWLDEAYSKAISDLDTGLLERAVDISNVLTPLLYFSKYRKKSILDFGGGLGVLARMLRDRGFKATSHDPMAESIFRFPDEDQMNSPLITMVEVLEHLNEPVTTIQKLASQSSLIFISTLAVPKNGLNRDWWYLLPDTGQHIFFPSSRSFQILAEQIGWKYFGNGKNLHVLSLKDLNFFQKMVLKNQALSWMLGNIMYPVLRSRGLGKSDMELISTSIFGD